MVEESKEPAKPEFAPMHSNPYASKKLIVPQNEEEPEFPGDALIEFADKEAINKLVVSSKQGEISANDSMIYKQAITSQLTEDDPVLDIFVGEPIEQGGVIKFKVKGFDSQGKFEIIRAFKDFSALRKTFLDRLPGLYIPTLPKPKFFGDDTDKNVRFLEERCFHLE